MTTPTQLYRPSPALLTDLYELTMACAYWKAGAGAREAVFSLFYRAQPFNSGYAVCCGLAYVIDYIEHFRFTEAELAYLAEVPGAGGKPLFDRPFLDFLAGLRITCDIDAIPEGTVVFPHEPLVRVRGPLIEAQLVESALLNFINFQTLIATKAARVCQAARGRPVLEFGLRRAQGIDGALTVARAAYAGGCDATSNVLAGRLFGIPVKGTHAHSWVMAFDGEEAAFQAYADAQPNNTIFLVDTYNTLEGVRNAIRVARRLRAQGHELVGVRLDSGDLAYLSQQARQLLNEAGFPEARIVASGDLDEHVIQSLHEQGAAIDTFGVGTRLVTAHDDPALGGVYKLTAIRDRPGQAWHYRIKLSEQMAKITTPGVLQVRRFHDEDGFIADMIFDEPTGMAQPLTIVDAADPARRKRIARDAAYEDLLVPIFRGGRCVYDAPALAQVRQRTADQLARLHPGIKRFVNPHLYPAGLERSLYDRKMRLVLQARSDHAQNSDNPPPASV